MPASITSGKSSSRRTFFFGLACATPSMELACIHHLHINKGLDGAHYPVAVLCDKWEHAYNTFAQNAQPGDTMQGLNELSFK
ncbi:hypothetical protein, partial [Pseudomonas sp. R81]|uniref:hypothetical protein n=1 Tax=Pseudomonas sp. R81 TaxID=1144885 RepID=UPI001EE689CD